MQCARKASHLNWNITRVTASQSILVRNIDIVKRIKEDSLSPNINIFKKVYASGFKLFIMSVQILCGKGILSG